MGALSWFRKSPVAPTPSGTGLASTHASARADALASLRVQLENERDAEVRDLNKRITAARERCARALASSEVEVEATRVRLGQEILAEFYTSAEPLVRAYMETTSREAALGLWDAYLKFEARARVELAAGSRRLEVVGIAFASAMIAETPSALNGLIGDWSWSVPGGFYEGANDAASWCDYIAGLERAIAKRAASAVSVGAAPTSEARRMFDAFKSAPTATDWNVAQEQLRLELEAERQAAFAATYTPPPRRPTGHVDPEHAAAFGAPRVSR
jgi:hypothetical protein